MSRATENADESAPATGPWKLKFDRAGEQITEAFASMTSALLRAEALTQQENTSVLGLHGPGGKRMTKEEIFNCFKNDL